VTLTGDGTIDHSNTASYVATTYNANPALPAWARLPGARSTARPRSRYQANVSYAGRYPVNTSRSGGVTARIDYDIDSHLALHSISALRAFSQNPVNYNNDGQARLPHNSAQPRAIDISDNYIRYRQHQFTQELQLQGTWQAFDFTGGLYYLFENFASERLGYVTGLPQSDTALPAAPFDQIGRTRSFNYSAYLQGNVHVTRA
jgi:iron complex outermembrane receptor protein